MGKKEPFTNNNDNQTMLDFPQVPKTKINTRSQRRLSTIQHPKQTFPPSSGRNTIEHENNNAEKCRHWEQGKS